MSQVIGRRARGGFQELAVLFEGRYAGPDWAQETRLNEMIGGRMQAITPFGTFSYGKRDSDEIANELLRLASEIRKKGLKKK